MIGKGNSLEKNMILKIDIMEFFKWCKKGNIKAIQKYIVMEYPFIYLSENEQIYYNVLNKFIKITKLFTKLPLLYIRQKITEIIGYISF